MRIYQAISLQENITVQLDEAATHHVARVMRARIGDDLTLFNGEGGEFSGTITQIDKKAVTVKLVQFVSKDVESPLNLSLALGISRGEKMDYTVQKAVELGVKTIIPLFTEYGNVKLDAERRAKKLQHWRSIVISACEQCGRTQIPDVQEPQSLNTWIATAKAELKLVLAPLAAQKLQEMPKSSEVLLLIGPEGGLSEKEIQLAIQYNFSPLNLGPRILRTETAAVAAVVALQCYAGDFFC